MVNSFLWGGGFQILFFVAFFLILGIILVTLIRGIAQWNKNNHSPRLTVRARVAAKRTNVQHHTHHANAGNMTGASGLHTTTSTTYYVTFEVPSGDRMELSMSGSEYGLLAEGDEGDLTFQGTRYLGFQRG